MGNKTLITTLAGAILLASSIQSKTLEAKLTQTPEYSHVNKWLEWKREQINSHIQEGHELLKESEKSRESTSLIKQAIREFENAISIHDDNCKARKGIGIAGLELGMIPNFKKRKSYVNYSIDNLERALECNEKDTEVILGLSRAYKILGNYNLKIKKDKEKSKELFQIARDYANQVIKIDKNSWKTYNMLGLINYEESKLSKAFDNFEKSGNIKPNSVAYTNIAHLIIDWKQPDAAIEVLNKALKFNNEDGRIYKAMSRAYQAKGDTSKMIEYLEIAIEKAPYANNWINKLKREREKQTQKQ